MSRQLHSLLPDQAWLSLLMVCAAFSGACGGVSDAIDEAGAGSSFGGKSSSGSAAGMTATASGGSVASGGQFSGLGGSGNSPGSGGNFPFAGTGGQLGGGAGASAAGGTSNGFGGSGGTGPGSGGTGGRSSGFGGSGGTRPGSGGTGGRSSGSSGSGGMGSATPTWTEIYTKYLSNAQYASNCNGAACHNPGKQKGYDFSSQANGYASVKTKTSQFVSVLSSGAMPQNKPKMPAADLAVIKAWVAAGALNN